jgi:hypothetical protein
MSRCSNSNEPKAIIKVNVIKEEVKGLQPSSQQNIDLTNLTIPHPHNYSFKTIHDPDRILNSVTCSLHFSLEQ